VVCSKRPKKYIMAGTIQSGKSKFLHFEREDGEWVNFGLEDIDKAMKTAGARYIQSDMRAGRIAISNILEARFKGKESFWEKYGSMITQTIFYLIVSVSMVIIFYQWGGIIDRTNELLGRIIAYEELKCPAIEGIVPAFAMLMFRRKNKWAWQNFLQQSLGLVVEFTKTNVTSFAIKNNNNKKYINVLLFVIPINSVVFRRV